MALVAAGNTHDKTKIGIYQLSTGTLTPPRVVLQLFSFY
jgi:hypothetical protein